jgi:uncharacterized metal-binding protein
MADLGVQCSYCAKKKCFFGDVSQAPDFCPTLTRTEQMQEARSALKDETTRKMAQDVARTWKEYGKLTRVEETIEYARATGREKSWALPSAWD